jgi:DNA-binding MarR family transcriptional regulator
VKSAYLESITLIERLHRRFLDVARCELERLGVGDINNVQALILFNIGGEEFTVGELTLRGYYLGTNVTYNLKKLVEHGYVAHARSTRDRRTVRVRLTEKGRELRRAMDAAYDRHVAALARDRLDGERLDAINSTMRELEHIWAALLVTGAPAAAAAEIKAA